MHFFIDPAIFHHQPEAKVGLIVIQDLESQIEEAVIKDVVKAAVKATLARYQNRSVGSSPKVSDWRLAHRHFGSSKPSSVEALLKRILKGGELPVIHPLIDLCNAISIEHELPIGAYDLSTTKGEISLTVAKGDEPFTPIGKTALEKVLPGEVIYRDEEGVLCSKWNYRQSERAKVSHKSKEVVIFIDGLSHTSLAEMARAMRAFAAAIKSHFGSKSTLYLLDQDVSLLSKEAHLERRSMSSEPSYHQMEAFKVRKKKLAAIRELGVDPYPYRFDPSAKTSLLQKKYEGEAVGSSEEAESQTTPPATIAGRLVLFRAMGKHAFAQLQDEEGRIQVMFSREKTRVSLLPKTAPITPIKFIEKQLDLGDIIGVKGHLFRTQKKELTLFVDEVTLLSKALLPLPDKHSGLSDKGTRYRKRWLDLITHPDVAANLKKRSQIFSKIRRYFEQADFTEVETPALQNIYGGAEARPFTTKLNALDQKMYLRIALEIALKKLIVGGMTRIFEIGKVFRNEGIDRTHNPEFTMLEAYAAYWDYRDVMVFVENLFAYLATELYGTTMIGMRRDKEGNSHPIDLKTPWKRVTMKEAIKTYGKIDPDRLSTDEMREKLLSQTEVDPEAIKRAPRGKLIAYLFEAFAEHHLIDPHHIIDHPIETTPLCKLHREEEQREQRIVERFETFILGCEICNAYSELNDPELQRELLQSQGEQREKGDVEANPMDEEFIEAICQGMPPTGGFGIGLDRLVMLFNDAFSIRDVIYFPLMRPEE